MQSDQKDKYEGKYMKPKQFSHKKRVILIVLLVISAALLSILLTAYLLIHSYINKMNLVSSDKANAISSENDLTQADDLQSQEEIEASGASMNNQSPATDENTENEEVNTDIPDSAEAEIAAMEDEVRKNMEENSIPIIYDKNVFNVLLIGSDNREPGSSGRSDAMILISINKKTKKIIGTSFLRDIYLQIPDRKNNRLNAAFAFGGADLLMETIEQNFRLKVDRYASIDFYDFMDIIDALGTITIDVTQEEIAVTNRYIQSLNRLEGLDEDTDCLSNAGSQLLNGKQALAYARNRYDGNGDFDRTARQRKVMEQVYSKIRGLNLIELNDLLNTVLPMVTTNLTEGEMFSLILSLPSYKKYDIEQWSVPTSASYKNMRINGMAVLGIDFDENIKEIRRRIYDEDME
jgi:polyisoprenyl-teichoic acid--peptidoglycan teichoic acid transferase